MSSALTRRQNPPHRQRVRVGIPDMPLPVTANCRLHSPRLAPSRHGEEKSIAKASAGEYLAKIHEGPPAAVRDRSIGEVFTWSAMKFALAAILSRRTEPMAARGRSLIQTRRKVIVFGANARCSSPKNFSCPRGKTRVFCLREIAALANRSPHFSLSSHRAARVHSRRSPRRQAARKMAAASSAGQKKNMT